MAVYYIDPHTTTNGTGTWASPFSFSTQTRTGVVAGDEIRIKGIPLTSLLTATTYTATYTGPHQLTLTAGGSLGADWAQYNIAYLPDFDTFFKVVYISGNIIGLAASLGTSVLPVHNSATTTLTVRKVDTATYQPSSTAGNTLFGVSVSDASNITISDGWTDATTRVTDGTVKTLINSSSTLSPISFWWDSNAVSGGLFPTGRNSDCPNTHVISGNTVSSYMNFNLYYGGTSTFNQIFNVGSSGYCIYGSAGAYAQDLNVTFKSLANIKAIGSSYAKNLSITVNNAAHANSGDAITNAQILTVQNVSINIGNIYANNTGNFLVLNNGNMSNVSITINGMIDYYVAVPANNGIVGPYGNYSVAFGPSFSAKNSKRTQTITSSAYKYSSNGVSFSASIVYFPTVDTPTGWTIATYANLIGSAVNTSLLQTIYPTQFVLVFPSSLGGAQISNGNFLYANAVYTFKDGTAPFEQLGFKQSGYSATIPGPTAVATVTTDATTFRTTGPSLKANVAALNTSFWISPSKSIATKTIKVPVTAGVSCTISGYIRTDQAGYVDGDCNVRVMFNNTQLATQSMTATAIKNAWGNFSLTFTPTYTGEAIFCWDLFYRNSGSFWLDDLTVS